MGPSLPCVGGVVAEGTSPGSSSVIESHVAVLDKCRPARDLSLDHDALRHMTLDVTLATVIRSFRASETERIWRGEASRRLPIEIQTVARRKLRMLNNAVALQDLRVPPANRLEALRGDRKGQHSIRVNDQYRICFVWRLGGAEDVEIVDYH